MGEPLATVLIPKFKCDTHADGESDGFGAGPDADLLKAAEQLRLEFRVVPDKAPMPSGPPNLWAAMLIVAAPRILKLSGSLPAAWAVLGVERDVAVVADFGEFGDWLDDAGFVVGEHGSDEASLRLQQSQ